MAEKYPSHVTWETYVDAIGDACSRAIDARWKIRFAQILLEDHERQFKAKDRQISELARANLNLRRAVKARNRKNAPGYHSWLRKFRLKNNPRLAALTAARAAA